MSITRHFGLNYVPSKNWYYCWNDWCPDHIQADFDAISTLGVDHLRVMVLWPSFQPNPQWVSEAHLQRLLELMRFAGERKLDVLLCPITGFLSGYRFFPPNVSAEDIFRSPAVFEQICLYLQSLLQRVSDCPNFIGFDLGNEINVLAAGISVEEGDAWAQKLVEWLRPKMKGKWIVNGVDHNPWINGSTFSLRHLVEAYDAVTIHAWSMFTGCLLRGRLDDPPSVHLSAYLTRLCRSEMGKAGVNKPVWIEEFGCSETWGTAKEQETYLRRSVHLAVQAGAQWFTWWCSHNIQSNLKFDSLEYDMGLFTTDNQPKPLAKVFRELVLEWKNKPSVSEPDPLFDFSPNFAPYFLPGDLPENWLERNLHTSTWKDFERYLGLQEGVSPR